MAEQENPDESNKIPDHKDNVTPNAPSEPVKPEKAPKPAQKPVDPGTLKPKLPLGQAVEDAAEKVLTEPMERRSFIKWLAIGWAAFAALVGGYLTMVLRYLFPNVLFEPKQTFLAGYPDEYQAGEVSTRWKAQFAVWVVRDNEGIYALSTVCTHLGCTPNWLDNDNKFKCPCHGSGFYKTGINFEGPAPRPLERYRIVLADDGQILIDKTKKYQQEKGEWKDPESYLLV